MNKASPDLGMHLPIVHSNPVNWTTLQPIQHSLIQASYPYGQMDWARLRQTGHATAINRIIYLAWIALSTTSAVLNTHAASSLIPTSFLPWLHGLLALLAATLFVGFTDFCIQQALVHSVMQYLSRNARQFLPQANTERWLELHQSYAAGAKNMFESVEGELGLPPQPWLLRLYLSWIGIFITAEFLVANQYLFTTQYDVLTPFAIPLMAALTNIAGGMLSGLYIALPKRKQAVVAQYQAQEARVMKLPEASKENETYLNEEAERLLSCQSKEEVKNTKLDVRTTERSVAITMEVQEKDEQLDIERANLAATRDKQLLAIDEEAMPPGGGYDPKAAVWQRYYVALYHEIVPCSNFLKHRIIELEDMSRDLTEAGLDAKAIDRKKALLQSKQTQYHQELENTHANIRNGL